MALLDRLQGGSETEAKIPVHAFMAALAEYKRGSVTGAQIISAFNLSAGEQSSLQEFLDNLDSTTIDRAKIHDVLILLEGEFYTIAKAKTELGIT